MDKNVYQIDVINIIGKRITYLQKIIIITFTRPCS